jgi:hypothetical protein
VVVEVDQEVDVEDEVEVVSCGKNTELVLVEIVVIGTVVVTMVVVDGVPVKDVHATEIV